MAALDGARARKTAAGEVRPIDDIRSTARYRAAVVSNLVVEFLERLRAAPRAEGVGSERWCAGMRLAQGEAEGEILPCCGSRAWARAMVARRPLRDEAALLARRMKSGASLSEADWMEAFRATRASARRRPSSLIEAIGGSGRRRSRAAWPRTRDREERWRTRIATTSGASDESLSCALRGKSSAEILAILRQRLQNDEATELREAAEQQRQITQLRLRKWLRG